MMIRDSGLLFWRHLVYAV